MESNQGDPAYPAQAFTLGFPRLSTESWGILEVLVRGYETSGFIWPTGWLGGSKNLKFLASPSLPSKDDRSEDGGGLCGFRVKILEFLRAFFNICIKNCPVPHPKLFSSVRIFWFQRSQKVQVLVYTKILWISNGPRVCCKTFHFKARFSQVFWSKLQKEAQIWPMNARNGPKNEKVFKTHASLSWDSKNLAVSQNLGLFRHLNFWKNGLIVTTLVTKVTKILESNGPPDNWQMAWSYRPKKCCARISEFLNVKIHAWRLQIS